MNYEKIYYNLINNAKCQIRTECVETHHILPKCFGGSNEPENLVNLTYREHYIAHLLLYKMQKSSRAKFQMATVLNFMSGDKKYCGRNYENARRRYVELKKELYSGENHPMYGTSRSGFENPFYGKNHSDETKLKISKSAKDMVIAKNILTGEIIKVSKPQFDQTEYLVGHTKGKCVSSETREKISKSAQANPKKKSPCINCGREMDPGNMKRHLRKCQPIGDFI